MQETQETSPLIQALQTVPLPLVSLFLLDVSLFHSSDNVPTAKFLLQYRRVVFLAYISVICHSSPCRRPSYDVHFHAAVFPPWILISSPVIQASVSTSLFVNFRSFKNYSRCAIQAFVSHHPLNPSQHKLIILSSLQSQIPLPPN